MDESSENISLYKKKNLPSNLLHIPTYKKLRKIELYIEIDKDHWNQCQTIKYSNNFNRSDGGSF